MLSNDHLFNIKMLDFNIPPNCFLAVLNGYKAYPALIKDKESELFVMEIYIK